MKKPETAQTAGLARQEVSKLKSDLRVAQRKANATKTAARTAKADYKQAKKALKASRKAAKTARRELATLREAVTAAEAKAASAEKKTAVPASRKKNPAHTRIATRANPAPRASAPSTAPDTNVRVTRRRVAAARKFLPDGSASESTLVPVAGAPLAPEDGLTSEPDRV